MMTYGVVGREGVFEHAPSEAVARKWVQYTAPAGAVVRPDPAQVAVKTSEGIVLL